MRLLIDECVSVRLTAAAHEEGFEAYHVAHRGWASLRDPALFARATAEGFIVVTNNRRDFFDLAGRGDLHPGLIVILPAVRRERQIELFRIALAHAASLPSMINTVVEIGDDAVPRAYELPAPEPRRPVRAWPNRARSRRATGLASARQRGLYDRPATAGHGPVRLRLGAGRGRVPRASRSRPFRPAAAGSPAARPGGGPSRAPTRR